MTEQDLQRIAFVTRRFHELQGLRLVTMGAGVLLGLLMWRTTAQFDMPGMSVMVGLMLTLVTVLPFVDRHYREAIGLAVAPGGSGRLNLATPHLFMYGMLIADVAIHDGVLSQPPGAGPSVAGIALILSAVWILIRDGARRSHFLLGVIAGALAVWVTTSPVDTSRAEALYTAYALVGLAAIGLGLLDHRVLMMSVLHGGDHARGPSHFAHSDTADNRILLGGLLCVSVGAEILRGEGRGLTVFLLTFVAGTLLLGGIALARERARVEPQNQDGVPQGGSRANERAGQAFPLIIALGAFADIVWLASGWPSIAALAFAVGRVGAVVRGGRAAFHCLIGALAGFAAAQTYTLVSSPAELRQWLLTAFALLGAVLLIEGLVDRKRTDASASPFDSLSGAPRP